MNKEKLIEQVEAWVSKKVETYRRDRPWAVEYVHRSLACSFVSYPEEREEIEVQLEYLEREISDRMRAEQQIALERAEAIRPKPYYPFAGSI
jgi:hypothetical protein